MVQCFVPDCNHVTENKTCKMFRFTRSPQKRAKWKLLIRRADKSPGKNARVCSCHFKNGDRQNLPEIFSRNQAKRALFSSPQKRKRQKKDPTLTPNTPDAVIQVVAAHSPSNSTSEDAPTGTVDAVLDEPPENQIGPSALSDSTPEDMLSKTVHAVQGELSENLGGLRASGFSDGNGNASEVESELTTERVKNMLKCKDEEHAVTKVELEETKNEVLCQRRQILILEAEIEVLQKSLEDFKIARKGFSISDIAKNPKDMSHYTGLPNFEVFQLILGLFDNIELTYYSGWNVKVLSKADQLFLTLFKLRRNPSFRDLARRFSVSEGTAANTFLTWLSALHLVLFVELMKDIPSRFKNADSIPKAFEEFPNCRMILDCTEMFAANPKKMSDQNDRYSNYKHRITYKALVGIAPNGTVTFLSQLYPGSASDKFIVQDCGILLKFESGDSVLADKGFLIADILPPGVTLNIPPFKTTAQMTPQQIEDTLKIAQPRVHIERAIRVIKTFQILQFIPGKCVPFATKVFQVCGALSNFKYPLIREVSERMK